MSLSASCQEQQIGAHLDRFLFQDAQAGQLSDHDQVVSRLVHNRLCSRFDASQWPLRRLHDFLKTLYESVDQADTAPAAQPSTPPSNSHPLQHESPRTHRAKTCLSHLCQLACWPVLLRYHSRIWDPVDEVEFAESISSLANRINLNADQLADPLPELLKAIGDPSRLASTLTSAYLLLRHQSFDTEHHALALALVHAAFSLSAHPKSAEVADANARFAAQFGRKYHGHAPSRFFDFVSRLDVHFDQLSKDDPRPYYRGTPVVQSSGTGKTRMVFECRHLTPLLYVCFRSNDAIANAKAGFPFPDNGVVDFFRSAHTSHPSLCNLHVACFLGAWFEQLAQRLDECPTDQGKHQHLLSLNRLDQNDGQNIQRTGLFKDITERAKILLGQATGDLLKESKYQQIFQHYIYTPYFDLQQQISRISLHLQSLHRHHSGAARPPPAIVAFDECVEMNIVRDNNGINPLNSLRRAWRYISELRSHRQHPSFWLVLMSTSSSAAHLVEHIDAKTSIRSKNSAPLPTFVGVGYDALLEEQPSLSCASEAFLLQHFIAYGRPLWSSLEIHRFWDNAKYKLIGGEHLQIQNAAHVFSVVASRLALSLVPTYSADSPLFARQKVFMSEVVDRHMRIVKRITNEAAMYIDSPSEPVLAIAASLYMLSSDRYGPILENFCQRCLLNPDMISLKGTYGELASRLALMVACDAANRHQLDALELSHTQQFGRPPIADDYAAILSQAVPLETILAGLANLDQDHVAQLRRRIRDVYRGGLRSGLYAMQSRDEETDETPPAWTHYTHFDVLPEEITQITPEYLWYCWKRGVALQMSHGQHGIDGIIPVFMGHLDRPFAKADVNDKDMGGERAGRIEKYAARYMTYVAWEAENRAAPQTIETDPLKAAKTAGPILTRPSLTATEQGPLTQRGLISVLLDMGTKTSFGDTPRDLRPRLQPITGQDCPRLSIRGVLDQHTYPCLDVFQIRPILSRILTADPTLHSRGDLNTMSNPVWNQYVQPNLPSISAAPTDQEQRQVSEVMDLD